MPCVKELGATNHGPLLTWTWGLAGRGRVAYYVAQLPTHAAYPCRQARGDSMDKAVVRALGGQSGRSG